LVQETLKRAFKGLARYRGGPTDVERLGWMRKILQNYTIEWLRKETNTGPNGRIERLIGEALDDSLNRLGDFAAKQSSPSQRAERNEEVARLCAALQLLRKEERSVIELHALEGLSIKDTYLRLGLKSPKAAAGLYARGLVHLRKLLGPGE
jgi:RNA polymerase sigma factor (sigma-70 family)